MNIDDQIEDAIALSRRTFLIGTAAAVALAALKTTDLGEVVNVDSASNYAERLVSEIMLGCEGATKDAVARLRLSRNDSVLHATAINVRGFYRWKPLPEEEPILKGSDVVKLVVEPLIQNITYKVVLTVWDMDYDGYWMPFVEMHDIPGQTVLNRLSLDPPTRAGPYGIIRRPPGIPEITDPRDLPPALYRNLDL